MILKLLISLIFTGAAVQKFRGTVAPNWDRWGYSRQFMYATGIAELGAVASVLVPGLELVGAAALGSRARSAHLATLIRHREGRVPYRPARADAAPGNGAVVPVNGRMTWK